MTEPEELFKPDEGRRRAEKSLTLQIKDNCRRLTEGDKGEAAELYKSVMASFGARLKKLKVEAKKEAKKVGLDPTPVLFLQRRLLDGRDFGEISHPLGELFWGANLTFVKARNQIEFDRKPIGERMAEIVAQFPVAEWWCGENGRDLLGLAQIIGETGDLWNYANPGKLWGRLGLGVEEGQAKRRRKGVDNGYNAPRRSVSWRIADSLFKGQSTLVDKETGEVKREAGPYRLLYDARKVRELEKAAEEGLEVRPAAKIPKGKASQYRSEGHIHKLAARYMEKRQLKHLWQIWRGSRNPSDLSFGLGGEPEG